MSIDATFVSTNASGIHQDVVVIFGVSSSDVPVNVTAVVTVPSIFASSPSTNWSGYQFCNDSGGYTCSGTPSTVANGAFMNFTQPNVYDPTGTGAPSCDNTIGCSTDIWTGLDTACQGVGGYILQTGSVGYIRNPSGLLEVTNYWLWWEDVESSSSTATTCMGTLGGNLISPGDTIDEGVYVSASNSGEYYVYSIDANNENGCSPTNPYTFSHTPYYEDFITERETAGTSLTAIAKFDTTTVSGQVEWGTSTYPISRPWGDGWYSQILMENGSPQVTNVCSGSWSGSSCTNSVSGGIGVGT